MLLRNINFEKFCLQKILMLCFVLLNKIFTTFENKDIDIILHSSVYLIFLTWPFQAKYELQSTPLCTIMLLSFLFFLSFQKNKGRVN